MFDRCMVFSVILLPILWFCYLCPYSKVEESFNMQALHDIAVYGTNLSAYDHHAFPGVVPRTFIGSLVVYLFSSLPLALLIQLSSSKHVLQLLVRFTVGFLSALSFYHFVDAVREKWGKAVAWRLVFITASQFHFFYYASRTLPNTFALILVLLSLSSLLRGHDHRFVELAGFAILVFRSELILFYGPCLLYGLIQGSVRIRLSLITTVILTAIFSIASSVLIDSWFWRRWLWPEGEVFYYNTILNKSSQWGTSPFYWYFTSALPRALMSTVALIPLWLVTAVIENCVRHRNSQHLFTFRSIGFFLAALVFVLLYSCLPHKELRFIIYTVPVFNLVAALFWTHVETMTTNPMTEKNRSKRTTYRWFQLLLVRFCYIHLVINLFGTIVLLLVSMKNYPGGEAIFRLNQMPHLAGREVHVHICNLAAQTGVTRFLEQHRHWTYNKTEQIEDNLRLLGQSTFTHLISELQPDYMRLHLAPYDPIATIHGFNGIALRPSWKVWKIIDIQITPMLTLYERSGFQ